MSINDSNYNFILDRRSASLCRKLSISIRRSAVGRFAPLTYCCIRLSFIPIARATCLTFNSGNSLNRSPTGFSPGSHLTICLSISHYFLAKIAHYFKTLSTGIKNNTRTQRRREYSCGTLTNSTEPQNQTRVLKIIPTHGEEDVFLWHTHQHHRATHPDMGIKNNTRTQRRMVCTLGSTITDNKGPHTPTRVLKIIPADGGRGGGKEELKSSKRVAKK